MEFPLFGERKIYVVALLAPVRWAHGNIEVQRLGNRHKCVLVCRMEPFASDIEYYSARQVPGLRAAANAVPGFEDDDRQAVTGEGAICGQSCCSSTDDCNVYFRTESHVHY